MAMQPSKTLKHRDLLCQVFAIAFAIWSVIHTPEFCHPNHCSSFPCLFVCLFVCFSAERLCCPHFKLRACGCLQSYIIGDGTRTLLL